MNVVRPSTSFVVVQITLTAPRMLVGALKLRSGALPSLLQHLSLGACQPVSLAQAVWQRWLATNVASSQAPLGQISARLSDSRGVLRLHGEDIHPFLNVSSQPYQWLLTRDVQSSSEACVTCRVSLQTTQSSCRLA